MTAEETQYRSKLYKDFGLTEYQANIIIADRKNFAKIKCEETIISIDKSIELTGSLKELYNKFIPQDLQ